ncbi:MAG TPA: hypothetical protein VMS17_00250 [Gemmataceae bacterium]|nr:hypothetical protein [Gemmataceae bacterium]
MTARGKVKNGKVILDDPKALPEGAEVEVRPLKKPKKPKQASKGKTRRKSLAEHLAPFIGKVKGLPSDASVNLDHYIYGVSKKK